MRVSEVLKNRQKTIAKNAVKKALKIGIEFEHYEKIQERDFVTFGKRQKIKIQIKKNQEKGLISSEGKARGVCRCTRSTKPPFGFGFAGKRGAPPLIPIAALEDCSRKKHAHGIRNYQSQGTDQERSPSNGHSQRTKIPGTRNCHPGKHRPRAEQVQQLQTFNR